MILLNVPYAEKDAARQLGARWDAGQKKWYVPSGALVTPFARWMPGAALTDKLLSKKSKPKAAKGPRARSWRPDDVTGKVTIGANYAPVDGATGLPWSD